MVDEIREELAQLREEVVQAVESLARRPVLRGMSHLVGCVVAIGAGLVMALHASGAIQLVAAIIFTAGLALALGTSALYHRVRWSERRSRLMQKLDHSMIFVLVASTYTPVVLLAMDGGWRTWSLVATWVVASAGVIMRLAVPNVPRAVMVSMYVGFGWVALLLAPRLSGALTLSSFALLVAGGLLYTLGAVIYLLRRPDPLPRIFGYHEVFHAFVVAGAACHFAAVWPLVASPLAA